MLKTLYSCLIILLSYSLFAQKGLQFNLDGTSESYTLLTDNEGTYLIDNCGYKVHEWRLIRLRDISYHVKLLPNGNVLYLENRYMYEIDWDGNEVYSFRVPLGMLFEYEIIKKDNGNYLCLGRESLSSNEFWNLGYNYSNGTPGVMDVILEIDPVQDSVVWEWHLRDHVIQERDSSKNNYGMVKENPQLLNMDAITSFGLNGSIESFMCNGMGYNEELQLISLSVRKLGEVIFIDNSTNPEESRGHYGGRYGKGGDVVFRWGNPQNYGYGTEEDRILYFQHNPIWVEHGEFKNKVSVFNNGLSRPGEYSSIEVFDVEPDENDVFPFDEELGFLPSEASFSYNNLEQEDEIILASDFTSGVQLLENGNLFITEGDDGRLIEVTEEGDRVWEYLIPSNWYIFRTEKYPLDYPAFDSKTLDPIETIESPPSNAICDSTISNIIPTTQSNLNIRFDEYSNRIVIESIDPVKYSFAIYDMMGKLVLASESDLQVNEIDIEFLSNGFYSITIIESKSNVLSSFKFTLVDN